MADEDFKQTLDDFVNTAKESMEFLQKKNAVLEEIVEAQKAQISTMKEICLALIEGECTNEDIDEIKKFCNS